MLKAKVEGYAKEDITLSRMMQVFAPVFVPRHARAARPRWPPKAARRLTV